MYTPAVLLGTAIHHVSTSPRFLVPVPACGVFLAEIRQGERNSERDNNLFLPVFERFLGMNVHLIQTSARYTFFRSAITVDAFPVRVWKIFAIAVLMLDGF